MKIFDKKQITISRIVLFSVLINPLLSYASSDSAKVICSSPSPKAAAKANVVGLISMDEVMPECTQHVVNTTIQNVSYSESGISLQSMSFKWHEADTSVLTNIGENPVLSLDDIRTASQFIQVGKQYLVHFQLCEGTSPSLISMYAMDNSVRHPRKSKAKRLSQT